MGGSDELRGENVPDGTWRTAHLWRTSVHGTRHDLAGTTERSGFASEGSRHAGTAAPGLGIPWNRIELAGDSSDGHRCNPDCVRRQLLGLAGWSPRNGVSPPPASVARTSPELHPCHSFLTAHHSPPHVDALVVQLASPPSSQPSARETALRHERSMVRRPEMPLRLFRRPFLSPRRKRNRVQNTPT